MAARALCFARAATRGVDQLQQVVTHQLKWWDSIRIDRLAPALAVVGARTTTCDSTGTAIASTSLETLPRSSSGAGQGGCCATRTGQW